MSDVVPQVGEAEEEFENLLAVGGVGAACAIGKRLYGMGGVGEEPIERLFVHRLRLKAAETHLVGAANDKLDEMIEANTLRSKRRGDTPRATIRAAAPLRCIRCFHLHTPGEAVNRNTKLS